MAEPGRFASRGARRERVGGVCSQGRGLTRPEWKEVVAVEGTSHGSAGQAASVPVALAGSRIEAELKNGVLIIHLPKAEAAKPKKISVRAR